MPSHNRTYVFLCSALLAFATPCLAIAADDGAKIVAEVCSQCHTASTRPLGNMHLTKEQWSEAIERMQGYDAQVPKGKAAALLSDYLARTNGPTGGPTGAATDSGKK